MENLICMILAIYIVNLRSLKAGSFIAYKFSEIINPSCQCNNNKYCTN